jgi:hypothetical protein
MGLSFKTLFLSPELTKLWPALHVVIWSGGGFGTDVIRSVVVAQSVIDVQRLGISLKSPVKKSEKSACLHVSNLPASDFPRPVW